MNFHDAKKYNLTRVSQKSKSEHATKVNSNKSPLTSKTRIEGPGTSIQGLCVGGKGYLLCQMSGKLHGQVLPVCSISNLVILRPIMECAVVFEGSCKINVAKIGIHAKVLKSCDIENCT